MDSVSAVVLPVSVVIIVWLVGFFIIEAHYKRDRARINNAFEVHTESYQRGYDRMVLGTLDKWTDEEHQAILDEMDAEGYDTTYYRKVISEDSTRKKD